MSYKSANGWTIDEQGLTDALDASLTGVPVTDRPGLDAFIVNAFSAANSPGMSAQARATCIAFFRNFLKKLP